MITADDGTELVKYLFPDSPVPQQPVISYLYPLHLLRGQHENVSEGYGNKNENTVSGDLIQFIGIPAAVIISGPDKVPQQKLGRKFQGSAESKTSNEGEWMRNNKNSSSMSLITGKGFTDANATMNTNIIKSVLTFDFYSIASRSKILAACSSSSKECYFFNLNISRENKIQENSPPIIFKFGLKNGNKCSSFSVSDIAIKILGANLRDKEREKEKEKEKNAAADSFMQNQNNGKGASFVLSNTATFSSAITSSSQRNDEEKEKDRESNVLLGKNILLLLGDTEGKVHFCVSSKHSILQTGSFSAHSSPIVAAITSGYIILYYII